MAKKGFGFVAKDQAPKTDSFANRLADALTLIENAEAARNEAESQYTLAKQGLSDLLKELPSDHPLRGLQGATAKAPTNGKRTRSASGDKGAIQEAILSQLLEGKEGGLRSQDFERGSHTESTFNNLLRAMAKDKAIKTTGSKRGTRYYHPSIKNPA